jgi:transcriptional regulator with XRE-family HTH domain
MQNNVRKLRKDKSWTQRQLAAAAGTSQQQIQRVEQSVSSVKIDLATKIARALGQPLKVVFPFPSDEHVAPGTLFELILQIRVTDVTSFMEKARRSPFYVAMNEFSNDEVDDASLAVEAIICDMIHDFPGLEFESMRGPSVTTTDAGGRLITTNRHPSGLGASA